MRGAGNLYLFESWHVDAKVAIKLQNTCFEAFIGFERFRQNSKFLEFVRTSYVDSVFRFGEINLYLGLEDIYFLLGLPVDGRPLVSGDFPASHLCQDLLGRDQPDRDPKKAILENNWLKTEFQHVPEDIGLNDAEIIPYVRAYILFIIGTLLLPESEKSTVPILYLHFLRGVTPDSLNSFAWGAAVLAKLHSWLSGNSINSKGAVWILEMFFLERIVRVRRDLLVDMQPVPAQFPSFKGWGSLLRRPSSNAHRRVAWAETFLNILDEDMRWRPYERFEMARQRIFYSRTIIFDFNTILYHRPDLVPRQLGIQNLDVSQLTEPIHLKPKSKRGHNERRLMDHYSSYIQEWDVQRYNTCIKDTSEDFVLPDLPHQQVIPPQEEPHGDSAETVQPHEEVHGDSPVQPHEEVHGDSPVQPHEEVHGNSPVHGDSSETSYCMDHGDSSHHLPEDPQDANMEHQFLRRSTLNRVPRHWFSPNELTMAPKGKRPKVGLTRMDAALDAMRPLRFSAQVVRKSVKKLLEVYGGDKWWFAIEEAGYKLLIDTILEEELEEKQIQHDHINEEQHEEQDPQESHELVEKTQEDDFEAENCLSLKEAIPNDPAIECTPTPTPTPTPTRVLPPPPDFLPTSPKRKPTYGWISDDDTGEEDENDFVTLTPARCSSLC